MASCNKHGVYEPDERLELPRNVKGWQGAPLAEIRLADLGTHWIWATSYQLWGSSWQGSSSPLMDDCGRGPNTSRAPDRAAAIDAAATYLARRLSRLAQENADAKAILNWLTTLRQGDLFGRAPDV